MRIAIVGLGSFLLLALPQAAEAIPLSCFVVHADPTHVDDAAFQSLVALVALADEHNVPLTLLFTAQWAELILADPEKTTTIAGFLSRGHEIGAHHHAYWATLDCGASWDGFTNTPIRQLPLDEQARFRGTMDDFWDLLTALPGIRTTACMGLGVEDAADWLCDVHYSTFGHVLSDAVSTPAEIMINGCAVTQIRHALLVELEPGELADLYAETSDGMLFAVIAHVSDYADRPTIVTRWFQFLAAEDAEGSRRATVADAVGSWADR